MDCRFLFQPALQGLVAPRRGIFLAERDRNAVMDTLERLTRDGIKVARNKGWRVTRV